MKEPKQQSVDEDDFCDLDPEKICDNCMKCVLDADFSAIAISGISLAESEE